MIRPSALKAYRAFDTVKHGAYIKRWLTQILINTIHDYQRKSKRVVQTVDIAELPESFAEEPSQLSPEEQLCQDEIDPALMKALQSVPEIFLTPLLLREIQEASYEEIAQILDIPKGTVMSRLSRARGLLRKHLIQRLNADDAIIDDLSTKQRKRKGPSNEVR